MTAEKSRPTRKLSEEEIDTIVEMQANGDSAWETPVQVQKRKSKTAAVTEELADRASLIFRKKVRVADD
jgi:hypothetical protein